MGVPGKFSARVPRWVSWNFGSHVGRTIARSIAGNLGLELLLLMLQGRGPGSLYPKWARKAPLVLRAIVLGLLLAMWPVVEQPRGGWNSPPRTISQQAVLGMERAIRLSVWLDSEHSLTGPMATRGRGSAHARCSFTFPFFLCFLTPVSQAWSQQTEQMQLAGAPRVPPRTEGSGHGKGGGGGEVRDMTAHRSNRHAHTFRTLAAPEIVHCRKREHARTEEVSRGAEDEVASPWVRDCQGG